MSSPTAPLHLHPHITHPKAHVPSTLHLFGYPIAHSIGPAVHTFVAQSVGLPWVCTHFETPHLAEVACALRTDEFVAGAVTMPLKLPIMALMDTVDDTARIVGAVNTITVLGDGRAAGSNTDAAGIRDALREASTAGAGLPAMVIGAGGASRAAMYALLEHLGCARVYLVNRDPAKAKAVVRGMIDCGFAAGERVVVVESVEQARGLEAPFYVVGCVPNNVPSTEGEKQARAIADNLFRKDRRGVFLDMCFKPRITQLVEIAQPRGYQIVDGIEVLSLQLLEQWRGWLGPDVPLPAEEARQKMRELAGRSGSLNEESRLRVGA